MKNLDTGLVSIEFASIAAGYRALAAFNDGDRDAGRVRLLEATPLGGRFLILALGEPSSLQETLTRARTLTDGIGPQLWLDSELIETCSNDVLEAAFSLQQTQIEESLVIVETETVSACFATAQTLVSGHGLKPIEIKIQRASTGGAYAFFTGASATCGPAAEDARTKLKNAMRTGRIEHIEAPNATFRSFFHLSGHE